METAWYSFIFTVCNNCTAGYMIPTLRDIMYMPVPCSGTTSTAPISVSCTRQVAGYLLALFSDMPPKARFAEGLSQCAKGHVHLEPWQAGSSACWLLLGESWKVIS